MDYEHPFVQEVRANPHDDAPRLIYADYLDEAGDERAELIRVQVALTHLPPGDPERRALELREDELLAEYADEWLAPLRALGAEGVSRRSFQRGLIERVRLSADAFIRHVAEICRLMPALYALELRGIKERLAEVVQQPLPQQITALDLGSNALERAEMVQLARSAWIGQVAELSLTFGQLNDNAAAGLASTTWPVLKKLNLSANRLGPAGVAALAARPISKGLTHLSLALNKLGDQGLQALLASPLTANLQELDLGKTGLTAAGLARLATAPAIKTIERLVLRNNTLGEGSERVIAALANAPRLAQLDLRGSLPVTTGRYGYGTTPVVLPADLIEKLGDKLLW
jgi:uncharacterized protein (TIGR02996 family)